MKKVFIVYPQFFDRKGEKIKIGGIETYIYNLSKVFQELGIKSYIYQFADINFDRIYEGIEVKGIKVKSKKYKKNSKQLVKDIEKRFNLNEDILLFASEEYVVSTKCKKVLTIQHGVSWDIHNNKKMFMNFVRNLVRAIVEYKRLNKCSKVVCVDYNFINWYRSTFKKYDYERFNVIPNFCDITHNYYLARTGSAKRIIFARRFVDYRGAILFAKVVKKLLNDFPYLEICIAGEGPCEDEMKKIIGCTERVSYTRFLPSQSIEVHSQYDIAVVPTIGSEGTSLSLLEAMSSGCAVVTTNIGGLTNIIIDGYNGIITSATEECIYNAIEKLLVDNELFKQCSLKGRETIECGFSHSVWKDKWIKLIESI